MHTLTHRSRTIYDAPRLALAVRFAQSQNEPCTKWSENGPTARICMTSADFGLIFRSDTSFSFHWMISFLT